MIQLLDIYNQMPINWEDYAVQYDMAGISDESFFELSVKDYLAYSKNDFKSKNTHSYLNALSNAKKAIDCKIDNVIKLLGYNSSTLNNAENVHKYIDRYRNENEILKDNPIKIKLLLSLGLAPQFLLMRIRELRNRAEHEYIAINQNDAREAIEVADLFINAINNKLFNDSYGDFFVSYQFEITETDCIRSKNGIAVTLIHSNDEQVFRVHGYKGLDVYTPIDDLVIEIKPLDNKYLDLMYIYLYGEYELLPQLFDINCRNPMYRKESR